MEWICYKGFQEDSFNSLSVCEEGTCKDTVHDNVFQGARNDKQRKDQECAEQTEWGMAQNKRFRDKLLWSRCRTQSARMTLSSTVTAALADGKIQIRYKTMLQDP